MHLFKTVFEIKEELRDIRIKTKQERLETIYLKYKKQVDSIVESFNTVIKKSKGLESKCFPLTIELENINEQDIRELFEEHGYYFYKKLDPNFGSEIKGKYCIDKK